MQLQGSACRMQQQAGSLRSALSWLLCSLHASAMCGLAHTLTSDLSSGQAHFEVHCYVPIPVEFAGYSASTALGWGLCANAIWLSACFAAWVLAAAMQAVSAWAAACCMHADLHTHSVFCWEHPCLCLRWGAYGPAPWNAPCWPLALSAICWCILSLAGRLCLPLPLRFGFFARRHMAGARGKHTAPALQFSAVQGASFGVCVCVGGGVRACGRCIMDSHGISRSGDAVDRRAL
jgi:hypothetical protein